MPITDAINTTGNRYYAYPELIVYLGDTNGNPPDDPPPAGAPVTFPGGHCTTVVRSAGGARLDFADIQIALSSHLQDRTQPASFARMVDVRIADVDAKGDPVYTRQVRGDYVLESIGIQKGTETLSAQVQLRPYHFGDPVTGYKVWDAMSAAEATITDDIIFNPTVDNETLFNRSNKVMTGAALFTFLWTHPELADTTLGETYQGQTRNEWSLANACQSMVELLNGSEAFIANPSSYAVLSATPDIRNVRIALGERLPDVLDKLLIPHGFNWCVDHDEPKPQIRLFKIGTGTEKKLYFQPIGTGPVLPKLDLKESNVNRANVSNGIGDSINEVQAFGEFEEAEVTIPLYAGWPASHDSYLASELAKDGTEYEGHESAWRLYVANEAGDLDPAVSRIWATPTVPDFSGVFTTATPHRRVLGEPLTYQQGLDDSYSGIDTSENEDERPTRRPIVLEWSSDAGETWQFEDPSWTVKLCPDQIGIYFDGHDIPAELKDADSDLRMRITGTIFGDARIEGLATKQTDAVNGRTFRQVLPVPEKFQKRWVQTTGTFASSLYGGTNNQDADERDDTADILHYAETLRDQNHFAEVDGEFRLPGIHTTYYQIGDLLTEIEGRSISLNMAPAGSDTTRYPQIVEIRLTVDDDGPLTVLVTDRGTA